MNDIATIISQLERQQTAIDRALAALREIEGPAARKDGASSPSKRAARPRKRRLSEEGRKRLALAMKRRWAAARKAGKTKLT